MIRVENLRFRYPRSDFALSIPHLEIKERETVAMIGPSGSGKTTLLHLIAGIQTPEAGRVEVQGVEPAKLRDTDRRAFRIRNVGLVFQDFALVEYLSVLDNVLLPCRINPVLRVNDSLRARAEELSRELGIHEKLNRSVNRLSQGEKQRVAVCRALLLQPKLVLADEPTGNLDPVNKLKVLDALFNCVRASDATLVTVTHDHDLLARFDRRIDFKSFYATPIEEVSA
jgi:putative ABC transport system ATP-binding protein